MKTYSELDAAHARTSSSGCHAMCKILVENSGDPGPGGAASNRPRPPRTVGDPPPIIPLDADATPIASARARLSLCGVFVTSSVSAPGAVAPAAAAPASKHLNWFPYDPVATWDASPEMQH